MVALLDRISLLFYTVIHLRWQQVWFRLYYRLRKPQVIRMPVGAVPHAQLQWQSPCVLQQSYFDDSKVCYLGEDGQIADAADWNNRAKSKLWLYNLHYFDDLNAQNSELRVSSHQRLIHRWIGENPATAGNGWEPYPLSLRLVNWIKWCSRERKYDESVVGSIVQQADALAKQLEYHILGNHLFANAKALVFVGVFLTGTAAEKKLKKGLSILRQQIPEQFLADGGHFELSPMYHAIVLWDLLDLINLAQVSNKPELTAEVDSWKEFAVRAIKWLQVMTHPDGEISFFNDSAMRIAARPAQIVAYGRQLGLVMLEEPPQSHVLLPASGYSRINMPDHTVLVDHAAVGPDYLPGHAHADSLSFEWSVGNHRVLVNSGTSLYGDSAERLRQRQTAAHNTVVVEKKDSSEVWSGFRVARRAHSELVSADISKDGVALVMSHNGYRRLPGKVIHERTVKVSETSLQVIDRLYGSFHQAAAMFHLHPAVVATRLDEHHIKLTLSSGTQVLVSSGSVVEIADVSWHPQFGGSVPSKKLQLSFEAPEINITFSLLSGS